METLPYNAELYDPFAGVFLPKLLNYLKGRHVALPSYRQNQEAWESVDFGTGLTPKQCIEELDELADFGDFDISVDARKYINGTSAHIIKSSTDVDGVVYRFTYQTDKAISDTNGKHFIKVENEG